MLNKLPPEEKMYDAFVKKDAKFEGVFVVGVKTTGIFCRPTCPARKPKMKNVEFFPFAEQALGSGYRPCKRCNPLQVKSEPPGWAKEIMDEVYKDSSKKWTDEELNKRGIHPNKVRRWFKKHYGITFHEYVRHQRVGNGLGQIKQGKSLIQAAFDNDYDSISGFREAIKNLTNKSAKKGSRSSIIHLNRIITPLGPMIVGTTRKALCLLEFIDSSTFNKKIEELSAHSEYNFIYGSTSIMTDTSNQIKEYFNGGLQEFSIPLKLFGTPFQQKVWQQLRDIPYGKEWSYTEVAERLGKKKAARAVANAISENQIYLVIPCHRVIGKNGSLTGYGGGIWRKKHLLNFEKSKKRRK